MKYRSSQCPPPRLARPLPPHLSLPRRRQDCSFIGQRSRHFSNTNNVLVTIWAKVYSGTGEGYPIPGWRMEVKREGNVVAVSEPSNSFFEKNAPADFDYGELYNVKLEIPNPGVASWEFYLIDDSGVRRSPIIEFTTRPENPNREIWVAFLSAQ